MKALGIAYDKSSEVLFLQGRQYRRGPSFAKSEYREATKFYVNNNKGGSTCILVDSPTELTAWLQMQDSDLEKTHLNGNTPTAVSNQAPHQKLPKQSPESKFQLTYRGVKINQTPHQELPKQSPDSKSQLTYRGVKYRPKG